MKQWTILYRKEMTQMWRNKQLIWLPLVMVLIGIVDIISYYYLPKIIEWSGDLPEGSVLEIPDLSIEQAIGLALGQLSFIGSLVIIAISMGTIASERQSGLAEILYTKPIHPFAYVTSKWFAYLSLSLIALSLAFLFIWYYLNILIDSIAFLSLLKVGGFYSLWIMLVLAITIFFNSLLHKPGLVFACSSMSLFALNIVYQAFGHRMHYFPNHLSTYIQDMLANEAISKDLVMTSLIILGLIILLLSLSAMIFKEKKLA